jgi:hypothetical protein
MVKLFNRIQHDFVPEKTHMLAISAKDRTMAQKPKKVQMKDQNMPASPPLIKPKMGVL